MVTNALRNAVGGNFQFGDAFFGILHAGRDLVGTYRQFTEGRGAVAYLGADFIGGLLEGRYGTVRTFQAIKDLVIAFDVVAIQI